MKPWKIISAVRKGYADTVRRGGSCCPSSDTCCGSSQPARDVGRRLGYSEEELAAIPKGANLGLSCGNPLAIASLMEGETVLDLGSGAGFDCFLAADRVGKTGRVIGVDMTPEMIERARENASGERYSNVEFRLGEIENLPAADGSVDVIISNCVINLSVDKKKVFQEAFRVLRPGGRMVISDIVLLGEIPEFIKNSMEAYVSCISGAISKGDYLAALEAAGFKEVDVTEEVPFSLDFLAGDPVAGSALEYVKESPEEKRSLAGSVVSIRVSARKGESP